jgi:acetyl esterase/lipase
MEVNPLTPAPTNAATTAVYAPSVPTPSLTAVSYGSHPRQVLDFWRADSAQPTPLVFVIHGGAWIEGEKERVSRFVEVADLLRAGISVVAINYRFIQHARDDGLMPPVKAPLQDAARALQFVRHHAPAWNLDKERVGAAGGSAGACASLWLAFHDDLAQPTSTDPVSRESTRLHCVAVKWAQTSLDPRQMRQWTPNSCYGGHAFGFETFDQFLASRDEILPWLKEYSPYELVRGDAPPIYLYYDMPPALGQNERDPTHSANFGLKLQEHCGASSVPCELVYPGSLHVRHANPTEYLIAKLKAK